MLDVLKSWELGKNLHSRIKYKKWIRFFFGCTAQAQNVQRIF